MFSYFTFILNLLSIVSNVWTDDRFILKEMSRTETHPFMDSAPQYFDYMDKCAAAGLPTLLGKIVGVFRVIYRSSTSNTTFRSNLLVMENLFYGRSVKHKFDLKGSVRNRLVNPLEQSGEIVLLDENLINSELYFIITQLVCCHIITMSYPK